jgi:MOSC domain-containing protein YiiM
MPMSASSVNVPDPAAVPPLRLVPAAGAVEVGPLGFAADPEHGRTRSLYAYPRVHLAFWRTVRAQARVATADDEILPGMFDEHLLLDGVQESQLWLGDVLRFPGCDLVVTGPRLPDARFDETLGFGQAAKMVLQSRWCGVWLGVLVPGRLAAGDPFELVPGPREVELLELFRARTQGRRR